MPNKERTAKGSPGPELFRTAGLDGILRTLKENEEIARKFFEIEVSVLSILDFKGIFERLLDEIREKFRVPCVWISLVRGSEISDLIQVLASSRSLRERLNILDRTTFLEMVGNKTSPLLMNEDLKIYGPILPPEQMNRIRSLAIAPITFHPTPPRGQALKRVAAGRVLLTCLLAPGSQTYSYSGGLGFGP